MMQKSSAEKSSKQRVRAWARPFCERLPPLGHMLGRNAVGPHRAELLVDAPQQRRVLLHRGGRCLIRSEEPLGQHLAQGRAAAVLGVGLAAAAVNAIASERE